MAILKESYFPFEEEKPKVNVPNNKIGQEERDRAGDTQLEVDRFISPYSGQMLPKEGFRRKHKNLQSFFNFSSGIRGQSSDLRLSSRVDWYVPSKHQTESIGKYVFVKSFLFVTVESKEIGL